MEQIKKIAAVCAIVFILCFLSYLTGRYQGVNAILDPLKEKITTLQTEKDILQTEKKQLENEYVKFKMQKFHEAQYFESRINAMYGSSSYVKYKKLLESMGPADGKR